MIGSTKKIPSLLVARYRAMINTLCRDDVNHKGEKIDWGQWAITGDDPDFGGTGNPDTGDDYGPAPGRPLHRETCSDHTGCCRERGAGVPWKLVQKERSCVTATPCL